MGFLCNSLHALQMAPKSLKKPLGKQGNKVLSYLKPQAHSLSAKRYIIKYSGPR